MSRERNALPMPFGIAAIIFAGLLVADPATAQTARKLNCNGCVKSKEIQNGGIEGADIKRNTIVGNKIKNNTISGNKIKNGSVSSADIGDGEVETPDLADNAVTSRKIRNGAVGSAEIGDGEVETPDLADNAVSNAKIQNNAVTGNKIADDSITADDLAPGSVGNSELTINAVDGAKITNRSIGSFDIELGAVGVPELADSAKAYGISGGIVVPFSAFRPHTETENYRLVPQSGYLRPDGLDTTICMTAPVYLPNDVTISRFTVTLVDNHPISNFTFTLHRVNISVPSLNAGTVDVLAGITTSGASPAVISRTDITVSNGHVSALVYAYYINGCITTDDTSLSSARLYSARINY